MKFGAFAVAAGFAAAFMLNLSWAAEAGNGGADKASPTAATEFGKTLPPVGFVKFCGKNPGECTPRGGKKFKIGMSNQRWKMIREVNAYVNDTIAPATDQELYGETEHWAFPVDAGDCEDYLLLKKRYLEGLGFPPETLLITVVLDEKNEGHAVLTLATAMGDFVLDNRRNEILRWNQTKYKFLKRQSQQNPLQWVALIRNAGKTSIFSTKD